MYGAISSTGSGTATINNNYAWRNITLPSNVTATSDHEGMHGQSISEAQAKAQAAWITAGFIFTATGAWDWQANRMPKLKWEDDHRVWPDWLEDPAAGDLGAFTISLADFLNVDMPQVTAPTLSIALQNSVTLTAPTGYNNYKWHLNNSVIHEANSITLNAKDYAQGEYYLTISFESGTGADFKVYSKVVKLTVTN